MITKSDSVQVFQKFVVVILILNLFLSMAGVSAQNSQVDCSKLAFSPEDIPPELRRYAETPTQGVTFFQTSGNPEVFPGKSSTFFRMLTASWKTKPQCNYYSGYDRGFRLRRIFSDGSSTMELALIHENMVAALFTFSDEATASSEYAQNSPSLGELKDEAIAGALTTHGKELTFTDQATEKYGEESSTWLIIGSMANLNTRMLCSMFKIGSTVAYFSSTWYEGNWPDSYTDSDGNKIDVLDPISPCKDAGLIALRTWSDRLTRELSGGSTLPPSEGKPLIRIEMKSDKDGYYSGERIILSGSIQKLVNGEYITYGSSKPFALKFEFPKARALIGFKADRPEDRIVTDENGKFSLIPFAPYVLGPYRITALLSRKDFPELKDYPQEWLSSEPCTFDVKDPPREYPANSQFVEIINLFKNCREVPPNNQKIPLTKLKVYPFVPPKMYEDEMNYGEINNLCYDFNGFHCAGYALKTMRFLNNLRFGIGYNDYERTLLRGIEYGPVMRGIPTEDTSGGEHYAVVLYNHWDYWLTAKDTRVLDPWPRQRPDNFTLQQFALFYGLDDIWTGRSTPPAMPPSGLVWDTRWEVRGAYAAGWTAEAVPLLGSDVYWNLDWPQSPAKYPEDPLEGLEGISITGGSPIALDISNDKGEHVGLCEDGRLTAEIQNSQLFVHPTSQGDLSWYVWLPKGNYHVRIRGLEDGTFHLLRGKGDSILYCYDASIERNETATLELFPEKPDEPLMLPKGEKVEPKIVIIQEEGDGGIRPDIMTTVGIGIIVIFIIVLLTAKRDKVLSYMPVFARRTETKPATAQIQKTAEKTLTCPACGTTNPSYSKYCLKCAGPIQQSNFCEECGKQIPAGSVYCPSCGDKQGVE